jgi:diguanylate cyclase (GGDEF)-like protein
MTGFLQMIALDVASAILLMWVFLYANRMLDKNDRLNFQFLITSLLIILQVVLEIVTITANGKPEGWVYPLQVAANLLSFINGPLLSCCFYIFVLYWVTPEKSVNLRKKRWLWIPILLNTVLCFVTLFRGCYFHISEANCCVQGPLYIIPELITYFYLLMSVLVVIRYRKIVRRKQFFPLILFGACPVIAGVVQLLNNGLSILWSACACSFIMVFIYMQQRMMQLDPLTGAWTKGSFDNYLEEIAAGGEKGERFGAIFIDLDNFKHINDTYGHMEGDAALRNAVAIIKKSIRKSDIVARFGGDEFVIIVHNTNQREMEKILARLSEGFARFNAGRVGLYPLRYSAGYGVYNPRKSDVWQFMNHVDHMMYQNKNQKHSRTATN